MSDIATRILAENDRTESDLFELANDANPMVQMLARRAYLAVNDVNTAAIQLESVTYWLTKAAEDARRFLSGERTSINGLGLLQGNGPGFDVAVGRLDLACEAATSALEALNEGIVIVG